VEPFLENKYAEVAVQLDASFEEALNNAEEDVEN
jgi:hypothetical protein